MSVIHSNNKTSTNCKIYTYIQTNFKITLFKPTLQKAKIRSNKTFTKCKIYTMTTIQIIIFISLAIIQISAYIITLNTAINNSFKKITDLITLQFFISITTSIILLILTLLYNNTSEKLKGKCPTLERIEEPIYKLK